MDSTVAALLASLAELAARNTAATISAKVASITARKANEETVNQLMEIINELVLDRERALGVAHGLKEELVSEQISDADISHVVGTVLPAVRALMAKASVDEDDDENGDSVEETAVAADAASMLDQLETLLTKDTLKVLQILGFNFRAAIGEPLTVLLRNLILAQAPTTQGPSQEQLNLAVIHRDIEAFRVAQDEGSLERLNRMGAGDR